MIHCIFCSLHFYIKKIEYCFLRYVTFLSRSELCHPWVPWSKAVKLLWMESSWVMYTRYLRRLNLFSLGFPFAKLLRNFCGRKRKFFLSLRISFARKSSNLRNHSQKSFRAKLPYIFLQLEFCAILQFRYNHMCVFLGIVFRRYLNSGKIWFWNVLLWVTLTCTTYWTNAS